MKIISKTIILSILAIALTSCGTSATPLSNATEASVLTATSLSTNITPEPTSTSLDIPPSSLLDTSQFADYFKIAYPNNTPVQNDTLLKEVAKFNPVVEKDASGISYKAIKDPIGVKLFVKYQDEQGVWGKWEQSLETQKVSIDSAIPFVNAMTNAGYKFTVIDVLKQGFTIKEITGKDGKKYKIASIPCGKLFPCQ